MLDLCRSGEFFGGLAQLARALAWHARGHRFDPDILHCSFDFGYSLMVKGGLAQLARAPALQAGGQRFESVILHFGQWTAYDDMFCSFLSTVL